MTLYTRIKALERDLARRTWRRDLPRLEFMFANEAPAEDDGDGGPVLRFEFGKPRGPANGDGEGGTNA